MARDYNVCAFPQSVFANVLLDENNKIVDWKGSFQKHDDPMLWRRMWPQHMYGVKCETKEFIVNNSEELKDIWHTKSKEFYKQYELAEDYRGFKPY